LSGQYEIDLLSFRVHSTDGRLINAYQPDEVASNHVGTHHFVWDGKDSEGNRAKPGVYIYELTVGANGITKREKGKIIFLP
jgi:flagellar hook assembly protein FlgD